VSSGVKVDDRQLKAALKELEDTLAGGMSSEHVAAVSGLLPGVRMRTPVGETGDLRSSWDVSAVQGGAGIESGLTYAGPVEYGVRGRFEGARMVRDTLEAEQDELLKAYERELEAAGKRAGFGTT